MTATQDSELLGDRWVARRHAARVWPSVKHDAKHEQAADDFDAVNRSEDVTVEAELDW